MVTAPARRDRGVVNRGVAITTSALLMWIAARAPAQEPAVERIRVDLELWANVLELYRLDHGVYPTLASIEVAATMAVQERYWDENPITHDPDGRRYELASSAAGFRIATADGALVRTRDLTTVGAPPSATLPRGAQERVQPTLLQPPSRAVGNTLLMTRTGNDIVWTWSGTGTTASGASSPDAQFSQIRTHFLYQVTPPSSYTWVNGITADADVALRFFQVSDETDPDPGGGTGGSGLPPPPPWIDPNGPGTNIASLYVGGTGVIVGQYFSDVKEDNWICFHGGVCTQPTTATATQLDFKVPPGALTGGLSVTVGSRTSDPASTKVRLESTSLTSTRTFGYSSQSHSYWIGGRDSAGTPQNSVFEVYYDTANKTWARTDKGSTASLIYACSTKTTRDGWLPCGVVTTSYAGFYAQAVDTDSGNDITNCANLGGGGNVRGAAADPNPGGVAGRDATYFAHAVGTNFYVKRVPMDATGCTGSGVNFGPNWYSGGSRWGAAVGMAVDPVTGDLYIAGATAGGGAVSTIYKIDVDDQSVTAVKGGFTAITGLDIAREGGSSSTDPGFMLVADNATTVLAFALDNTSAPPVTVTTATTLRTVAWGRSVIGGSLDPVTTPETIVRNIVVHNDDSLGRPAPLRPDPMAIITPSDEAKVWISSPTPLTTPPVGQGVTRMSYPPTAEYSTGKVELRWADENPPDRQVCAWIGDPGKAKTGYEPDPLNPARCDIPIMMAAGPCDNQDSFNPVGTFVDSNDMRSCKTCGSADNPCEWEFRITQRFGGDSYRVYFTLDQGPYKNINACSPTFTAWKRAYLEKDRMYRGGGLLFDDYIVGTNQLVVYEWTNVMPGDTIVVFDERQLSFDSQTVTSVTAGPTGAKVITLLGVLSNTHTYLSADRDASPSPRALFTNLHSAGLGVTAVPNPPQARLGLYEADTSNFWMPFDEGFVSLWERPDGAQELPFLALEFFDTVDPVQPNARAYFSQLWFKNFESAGAGPVDAAHNYFHLMGVSKRTGEAGIAQTSYDYAYVFVQSIEDFGHIPVQTRNHIRATSAHEIGHQFFLNTCTTLANCGTPPPPDFGTHDYRPWWLYPGVTGCPNPEACLMDPGGQLVSTKLDGIDHFCFEDLLPGDPNCTGPPGTESRDTSIRRGADPR